MRTKFPYLVGGFLLALIFADTIPLGAQSLDTNKRLTQFVHETWTEEDGMPQSTIDAIVQTGDGYMWIGTQEGLVRFNGVTFTVYDKTTHSVFERGQKVRDLFVDSQGRLWIGLESGLVKYENGKFEDMSSKLDFGYSAVIDIAEDDDSIIWFATVDDGVIRTDGEEVLDRKFEASSSAETPITALLPNPDGSFWVGTVDGLYHVRNSISTRYGVKEGLHSSRISALFRDREGTMWVSTFDGVNVVRRGQVLDAPAPALNSIRVQVFFEDLAGAMWMGSNSMGVLRMTAGDIEYFDQKHGLTHNSVMSIFEDRESGIWIGTDGGGLNTLREGKFTTFTQQEGLPSNMVFTVFEGPDGGMWFGTESEGVAYLKNNRFKVYNSSNGLSSNYASALASTPDGAVWVGTYGAGLNRIHNGRISYVTEEHGLPDPFIAALYSDPDGTLWIGTNSGIVRMDPDGSMRNWNTDHGLSNNMVTSVTRDAAGALWVGNWDGGLHRLDGDQFTHYGVEEGLGDNTVMALYPDPYGALWIATYGGGLSRFQDSELKTYTMSDGLFNELIYTVLEDDLGWLWLTCNNGIFKVRKADFARYDAGEIETLDYEVYTRYDGLKSKEMNGGLQPAGWKGADGRLWFPSIQGIAMIDPANIRKNEVVPPVVIEKFRINDVAYSTTGELVFPPGVEKLEIVFAALSFQSPELIKYRYQLIGQDEDWVEIGPDREIGSKPATTIASYTNMKDGEYTFRLQARNHDGTWNRTGVTLKFRIEPHITETTWFIIFCILLGLGVLAASIRIRTVQMAKRQQELEFERDRARAANSFKSVILDNLNHEFRTPLTGILGYADLLEQELSDDLQEFAGYIITNGRRLLSTLDSLLELARIQNTSVDFDLQPVDVRAATLDVLGRFREKATEKNLKLNYEVADAVTDVELDATAYQHALAAVIENAIKFTDRGTVQVKIDRRDDHLEVRVIDTGVGIHPNELEAVFEPFKQLSEGLSRSFEGAGVGLTVARHLVESMRGVIVIESSSPGGTTLLIQYPLTTPSQKKRTSDRGPRSRATERVPQSKNGLSSEYHGAHHPAVIDSSRA